MAENTVSGTTAPQTEPESPQQAQGRQSFWSTLVHFFLRRREASIVIIAIALLIYFQSANSDFLSTESVRTLFQYFAATAIIAAGEVMLLICGEIDLSVGQVFALAPFIMYFAYQDGLPIWVGIILGLLVSALVGNALPLERDQPDNFQCLPRPHAPIGYLQRGNGTRRLFRDHLGCGHCDRDADYPELYTLGAIHRRGWGKSAWGQRDWSQRQG